jgi:DNA polymerase-1
MAKTNKTLLLVDGMALAYQSFYALQNLRSPEGRPTGAVYGFYQTVESLLSEYNPDFMAVAVDIGEPTSRTGVFQEYKADRAPTPTELLEQFPLIEEMLTLLGIPVLGVEGIEADDIIGTLALQASEKGYEVFIFTPDKDILQIVKDGIRVIRRHGANTKIYDSSEVQTRYGVRPDQFADLLGLMGDKVDSIPGVPGVGEKTAASLLAEYHTLEGVLEAAGSITKKKLSQNLRTYREQAILSRDLAVLNTRVDLQTEVEDLCRAQPDWAKAAEFFTCLGFRKATESAITQAGLDNLIAAPTPAGPNGKHKTDYRLIQTVEELVAMVETLQREGRFGLDTETTSVDCHQAELVGICLGIQEGRGWYLPVAHKQGVNLPLDLIQEHLGPLLADDKVGKIGHHLKYDARILARHGMPTHGWVGDTMVLAHLLHSQAESLKLDDLVKVHLGRPMIPIQDLIGEKKSDQICMSEVPIDKAAEYGAEDAEATVALNAVLEKELEVQEVRGWYESVELPLAETLMKMEAVGVQVDPHILARQSEEVGALADRVQKEIYELAGREFNPNSPKQLAEILFDERGVPESKGRSTRQDILEDLARAGEPLAEKIIENRRLTKLKSTYLDALPVMIDPRDGRVHTSYNPTIANTGRISSNNPNLQNIPIRTDLGRRVREAFIAREGCVFVSADYSQIELRVLAHFSEDPGFIRAFQEGHDIHAFTAAEIFEVSLAEVDKDMRRKAKEINFGLNYGMSSFGLASRLCISRGEARNYMDRYFTRYNRIKAFFDGILASAERDGYVTTLAGRRVEVPRPRSRTGREARAAINAPIQGSAADILKKAMVEVDRELSRRELESVMVLTVHDEIILEVPEGEVDTIREILPPLMEGAFELTVPVVVDVSTGKSWADLD